MLEEMKVETENIRETINLTNAVIGCSIIFSKDRSGGNGVPNNGIQLK